MTDQQQPAGPPKSIDLLEKAGQWKTRFYSPNPPDIKPEIREVFEKYSKIPPNEIDAHLETIRQKAWSIHPYPCIGQWRFLDMAIGTHATYPEVLRRMLTGSENFLDLGCAFAQDIRKLVYDGVDSRKCYGSDLRLDFVELGYELFRDRETLGSTFLKADFLDPGTGLEEIEGKMDIIDASSFFHLFDWEEQKRCAHQAIKILRPRAGSLVVGRQSASFNPGHKARNSGRGERFKHSLETWEAMWREVGVEAGVEFEVTGFHRALPKEMERLMEVGDSFIEFTVRRL